jgi:hypothetical protein
MPPLHELSLWQRIAIAIAAVLFAVLMLVLVSWLEAKPADAQAKQDDDLYGDLPIFPSLLNFDKRALDDAYEDQIKHLFSVWVKGQATSNKEITNGLTVARRAYTVAAEQIAKRQARIMEAGEREMEKDKQK